MTEYTLLVKPEGSKFELKSQEPFRVFPGDTITIAERIEPKKIDLSCVVGTSIPMLFFGEPSLARTLGRLEKVVSGADHPYHGATRRWSNCQFDTSDNNWVSYGKHVPWYTGQCPLPIGVKFTYITSGGMKKDETTIHGFSEEFWSIRGDALDITAFRVNGKADGYTY